MQTTLFTERENEVLRLLQQGLSNKQMAMTLRITERTVEFHLSNIFTKLGVNSRTEAVLRLADQVESTIPVGTNIRESTVVTPSETMENGENSVRFERIPMKKKVIFYIAGAVLVLAVVSIILFKPITLSQLFSPHTTTLYKDTSIAPTPITETAQISEITGLTPSATGSGNHVFSQSVGVSTSINLTLEWFYIDSQRVNLQFSISGFPIPAGAKVNYLVDHKKIRLLDSDGNQISFEEQPSSNRGEVISDNVQPQVFEITLDAVLLNSNKTINPADTFQIMIPVGGKEYDNNSQPIDLPEATFKISTASFYPDSLTFVTNKTAKIQDKTINFYRLEVNPEESYAYICVTDPAGEQWLPDAVSILYKGNSYLTIGEALTGSNQDPLKGPLCYRLSMDFPVDLSENPKPDLALWVFGVTKPSDNNFPPEMVEKVTNQVAKKGITFNYEGREIKITQKPVNMTDDEANVLIKSAFTQEATANGILVFDLN